MTRPGTRRLSRTLLLIAGLFVAGTAAAQEEPKVPVQVDVVVVSNQGSEVQPRQLAQMKQTFASQGLRFSSFRQLSSNRVEVARNTPAHVSLPNGKTATLRLIELKEGTARVSLEVPGVISSMETKLGREGTVYQKVGEYQGGNLVLALSAAK
ncbi:MAG: hypothetical protein L0Y66_22215 [Myxococcaceae bacterium]|nr:hypothetical protein [Myxococcaceae bacterium]